MKFEVDHIEARRDVYRLARDAGFPLCAVHGMVAGNADEWQDICLRVTREELRELAEQCARPWDFLIFISCATAGREARQTPQNERRAA